MADLLPQERLQPFLLDCLRDDAPGTTIESRDRRAFTMNKFRDAVLRDLSWLLNAKAPRLADALADFPLAERSVLNYGMPDISGSTLSEVSKAKIAQMVRRAIETYEPRILRNSLSVRCVDSLHSSGMNTVALEIKAQVWALPLPESLYVKTEVDLETGDCHLKDQAD